MVPANAFGAPANGLQVANVAIGKGVDDIGQMMDRNGLAPDSMKKRYNCYECGKPQWVWKGVPFEGICNECYSEKGIIEQVGAGIGGVFNGVMGYFK
jgi:hypothetical protein